MNLMVVYSKHHGSFLKIFETLWRKLVTKAEDDEEDQRSLSQKLTEILL